jgi:predicted nucleotidyltransferase component of viral defense system
MLDQAKHKVALIEILKDIYGDPELRTLLGFKGGTAAMLFYDLPRLSVDLDFDLLDAKKKDLVFARMKTILERQGVLRQAREKRYTLFFLMSYEKGEHTIKIEISKRKGRGGFEIKDYLGINALVMRREDMVAGKMAALLTRRKFAARDVFDLWFFLKNKWLISETVLTENTGLSLSKALEVAAKKVNEIDKNQVLQGLGELLNEKQKTWARKSLINETVFLLRDYRYRHLPVSEDIPVMDIEPGVGGTGGPQGHFVHFQAINIGEKVAIDVKWGIRGFAYEWRSPDVFVLRPGEKKKLEYKISDERPFKEFVPELNIIFEYKDNKGVSYFTRRELVLEKVPSGAFYNIRQVGTFHPAVVLQDSKIRSISDPYIRDNLVTKVDVEVDVNGKTMQIQIGISPLLIKIFNFSEYELKAAFSELVQRKVRNMLRKREVKDYIFKPEELPKDKSLSGFEAYQALRDSLDR